MLCLADQQTFYKPSDSDFCGELLNLALRLKNLSWALRIQALRLQHTDSKLFELEP